jgi:SAM-dependent methyltransferase
VVNRALFRKVLRLSPAEPATALWRAIEIGHLLTSGALPREGNGLDLGCGDGRMTRLLRDELEARWQLVGLEPDRQELALALAGGVYERVADARGSEIPESDDTFDFVFSNSVLEHIDDLEGTLAEVGRILCPGGTLVFTVPSTSFRRNLGAPGPLGMFVTRSRTSEKYHAEIDRRLQHVRYWSTDEWKEGLAAAGLELVEMSAYMTRRETRRWAALSNATGGLLCRIGGGRYPIEIQRSLGLRIEEPPLWVRWAGRAIGETGALGLGRDSTSGEEGSCLLGIARKPSIPT